MVFRRAILSLILFGATPSQDLPGFDEEDTIAKRVEFIDPIPKNLSECNQHPGEELRMRTLGEPERTLPEVPDTLLGTDTGVIADGAFVFYGVIRECPHTIGCACNGVPRLLFSLSLSPLAVLSGRDLVRQELELTFKELPFDEYVLTRGSTRGKGSIFTRLWKKMEKGAQNPKRRVGVFKGHFRVLPREAMEEQGMEMTVNAMSSQSQSQAGASSSSGGASSTDLCIKQINPLLPLFPTTADLRRLYEPKTFRVRVHVIRGRQLVPKDMNGRSDPYLVFRIGDGKGPGRTSTAMCSVPLFVPPPPLCV